MKRLEQIQFGTLLLAVACIAINWRAGLWATLAFAFVSLLRLVVGLFENKGRSAILNPAIEPRMRWGLWAMVGYWLLLLLSMIYSDDTATGWSLLFIKASILFYPLSFLLTDTRYLTSKHLRIIGYALVAALLLAFFFYVGAAIVKMADGASLESVTGLRFDPRHHTYTALYLAVALLFIHYELTTYWSSLPRWRRRALATAFPLLVIYVILVNSRSGMLTLYGVELYIVLHYAFTRRNWLRTLLLAVVLGGFTAGMEVALPGHDDRLATTISDVSSDERIMIYKSDLESWMESPLIGYGVGDYRQQMVEAYNDNDFSAGVENEYNAHNQYIETLLSTGLIGLAVLLFWMLWPTIQAWRTSRRDVFWLIAMFTFCFMLGCLFESMLERQMGVLFIGALMAVMTLTVAFTSKENKQLKSNRYE